MMFLKPETYLVSRVRKNLLRGVEWIWMWKGSHSKFANLGLGLGHDGDGASFNITVTRDNPARRELVD